MNYYKVQMQLGIYDNSQTIRNKMDETYFYKEFKNTQTQGQKTPQAKDRRYQGKLERIGYKWHKSKLNKSEKGRYICVGVDG